MAKEYNSWEEFDFKEMEKRIREDERYGLIFYMTDRILSRIGKEHKYIWKLVIPRVLTVDIVNFLFKDNKILDKFLDVGLVTKGIGKNWKRYYLHDEVYFSIVAYFEREFKGNLSSWHDSEPVAKLHKELIEFYTNQKNLDGVNTVFEVCYHKIMLKKGFEDTFKISREEFANYFFNSMFLDKDEKFRICNSFDSLKNSKICQLIEDLKKEELVEKDNILDNR